MKPGDGSTVPGGDTMSRFAGGGASVDLSWPTGLVSRCHLRLESDRLFVTRTNFGRARTTTIDTARIDPTPRRVLKRQPMLFWMLVIGIVWTLVLCIDWQARSLATQSGRLLAAALWAGVSLLIFRHYARVTGVFDTWVYQVSRETIVEIPRLVALRADLASYLRVPTLPADPGGVLVGSGDDRAQQLGKLLGKHHITDEEYRVLTRRKDS